MPTVLALYPGTVTFRVQQVRRYRTILRDLGVRLVLADDFLTDDDREVFDELVPMPPCDRVEEGQLVLERRFASGGLDAVLAQSESSLLLGSLLAQRLGLRGIRPEAALLTVSKFLCRRALERAGVRQPRFAIARSAADVRKFAREVDGPVVIKGTASALGRLVTLVRSDSEVDRAVERTLTALPAATDIVRLSSFARSAGIDLGYDPSLEFLVEAFAHGAPVETDGIVFGSEPISFGVTEQVLSKPPLFFMEGYLLPADRSSADIDEIERVSDAALAALGISDTGYSIEMRLHEGRAAVIEVNGRLGWDAGFGDLFEIVAGSQPAFLCLQASLGVRPRIERRSDVRCAVAYRSSYADGIIASLPSAAQMSELEREGVMAGSAVHVGEHLHAPPHPDASPHLGWALARHPSSSRAAYERARAAVDRLRFEIEPARS
ncbi:MAG: acetyl-CoA carboxylase biotin carboxylase subunit family protein [Planctomycetota bacterium]